MNRQSRDKEIYFGNTEESNSQNVRFHNCLGKNFLLHLLSPGQWLRVISNVFISIFKFEKGVWNKYQAECLAGGASVPKTQAKWALTKYVNFAFHLKACDR